MLKLFVRTLAGVMGVSLLANSFAFAATSTVPVAPSPGQGLEISPPIIQLDANPGQTITTQIRIRDVTTGNLNVNGTVDDFGAGNSEDGTPQILLNGSSDGRFSLRQWITGVPNFTLTPQELASANIVIHVPTNAEPGGHYAVVRFTGLPPGLSGTGVSLSASVGTLILLRVSGQVTEQLNLSNFQAGYQATVDNWVQKSFFEHGPIDFLVRLQNVGTVHESPAGSVTVKNMFGKTDGVEAVNGNKGNILPDSYRRWKVTLPNKELFGYYTATLNLTYASGKTISGTTNFWVIPWTLILLVLVILAVLWWLFKVGIKKYNEHIISMARRRR